MRFTTESKNKIVSPITITIDAGHGGYDSGAVGPTGVLEKNIALSIALKVGEILSKNGINVVYTRMFDNVVGSSNEAFNNLSNNTQDILAFIDNNVNPDYELFLETAEKYEKDVAFIKAMSEEIASGMTQILNSIEQTSLAIENVSTTAQQSASSSEGIVNSVGETNIAIEDVAKSAQRQAELAEELNSLVQKFKI